MRKPIVLLNVVLLLLVVALAAGIRVDWRRNHGRYTRLPAWPGTAAAAATTGATGAPARLLDSSEFVNRNLFSVDRNNVQPVIKREKRQAPPLPVVSGTMNLGSGMIALMAEPSKAASGSFRRVKAGDEVGGYKIAEIAEHKVVLEFEGEKSTVDVYESAASIGPAAVAGSSAPAPSSQVQTVGTSPTTTADSSAPGSSPAIGGIIQNGGAMIAAPSNPEGVTIEGDYRVTRKWTAFGMMTYREPIAPQPKAK